MDNRVWFIGTSRPMCALREDLEVAVNAGTSVLITGERGVRKDALAGMIHSRSDRRRQPFVTIDWAAAEERTLESGCDAGLRPCVARGRHGSFPRLEAARGGTMFVADVGNLTLDRQALLMRVLDAGDPRAVDRETTRQSVDVRVIAASSRNLWQQVMVNRFREDLFYRLNVVHLVVPPLRERRDAIPALVRYLIRMHARADGHRVQHVTPEAMERLVDYSWPGNMRELSDAIERILSVVPADVIQPEHLPLEICQRSPVAGWQDSDSRLPA